MSRIVVWLLIVAVAIAVVLLVIRPVLSAIPS
jgi:hypothetical protein